MADLYDRQGNLQQVPDDQAGAAVATGQFAFAPGKVQVTQGDKVFDVDAKEAPAALANGFQLSTPEEVHHSDVQNEYGGALGAVQAAGFGAGSQLGLGFADEALIRSKAALQGVDPEQIREEVRGLKEANPWAFHGGQALGMVAPALLSGGTSLAGEEAGVGTKALLGFGKAITTPGRLLGELGEAGAGVTGALAGEGAGTFAGRLAQRMLPMAVQGGLEGSVLGAGDKFSEAALGDDHELSAEKIFAGAKSGLLFGTAAGGALGALAGIGSEVKRGFSNWQERDVQSLAERVFGHAPKGLGDAYAKAASAASGGEEATIRELTAAPFTKDGAEVRRVATSGDEIRSQAVRDLREHVDQIQAATRNLTEEAQGRLKVAHVEASVARGNEAQVFDTAATKVAEVKQRVQEMLADPSIYGQRGSLKAAETILDGAEQRIGKAFGAGKTIGNDLAMGAEKNANAQAFVELDYLKRRLGKFAKPGQFVSTDQETAKEFRTLYEGLKDHLEDEGIWGKAAIQQKTINKAWADYLGTNQLFENKLTTEVGRDVNNPWLKARAADPAKIQSYVDNLTNPNNDLTHQLVKQQIEKSKELASAISQQYELPAAKAKELAKIQSAASAFGSTVSKAERSLVLGNQLKELLAAEGRSAIGGHAATVGALIGGAPGALVGSLVGAVAKPGANILRLAALERMAAKASERLSSGVREFVQGTSKVAQPVAQHVSQASLRSTFTQAAERVRQVASDPMIAMQNANKSLGPIHDEAPNVAIQMAYKAMGAAKYLNDQLPKGTSVGGLFAGKEPVRYSDAEMAQWLRVKRVVDDPLSVVDDMHSGHVSPSDMATIKQVYPKLHTELQNEAFKAITDAEKPLPYQKKMTLGVVFGISADKFADPDAIQAWQQGYQAPGAPDQGPGGRGPAISPAMASRQQKTIHQSMTATQAIEGAP